MSTVRKGSRGRCVRYFCKRCQRKFSVNYRPDTSASELLNLYLDGVPFRKIGFERSLSGSTIYRKCFSQLKLLPSNIKITQRYADVNRYNSYLVFDGKYLNVKGYAKGVVLLWGVDFETHDVPHYLLAPSESYIACLSYFSSLKALGYNLRLLVCDDNDAIKMAVRYIYPNVVIQTCQNHFLESIRRDLNVRSSKNYQSFFLNIELVLKEKLDSFSFNLKLQEIYKEFRGAENEGVSFWIGEILRRKEELLAYQKFPHSPATTNLIEAYNSHLEGRLRALKGFESFHSANLWINGYILRRRLKPFTDCGQYFKHLNGKKSLERVLKSGLNLPQIFT